MVRVDRREMCPLYAVDRVLQYSVRFGTLTPYRCVSQSPGRQIARRLHDFLASFNLSTVSTLMFDLQLSCRSVLGEALGDGRLLPHCGT